MKEEIGNPALLAVASNPTVQQSALNVKRGIGLMGKVILIAGVGVAVRFGFRAYNRNKILKEINTNVNYRAATKLYNLLPDNFKTKGLFDVDAIVATIMTAIIPVGEPLKVNEILNVGKEITDFQETTKAFKILYKEDLRLCLEKILSPQELDTFYNYTNAHKIGMIKVEPKNQEKLGYRVVTTSDTSVLTVSKSALGKLSKPIQLSRNIPANTSCGTFEGGTVKNVRQNDNREFYVCKIGKSGEYNVYILVSTKSSKLVPFSKPHSYKTISFKPTTGEVTEIS